MYRSRDSLPKPCNIFTSTSFKHFVGLSAIYQFPNRSISQFGVEKCFIIIDIRLALSHVYVCGQSRLGKAMCRELKEIWTAFQKSEHQLNSGLLPSSPNNFLSKKYNTASVHRTILCLELPRMLLSIFKISTANSFLKKIRLIQWWVESIFNSSKFKLLPTAPLPRFAPKQVQKKIGIVPCYRILQSPRVFPQSTVHGKTSDTFASVNELTIFTFVELPRIVVASVHTIFNVLRLPQRNDNFHGLLSLLSYASEIHGYVISFK